MQAGRRRGDRAGFARVDGLVALVIGGVGRALDVRRQRHAAEAQQQFFERLGRIEAQHEELAVASEHRRRRAVIEQNAPARLRLLADAELHARLVRAGDALDQDLDGAAGVLAPVQPRRQHARVVEDEQIARREQLDEIGEAAVVEFPVRRVDDEQAARRALRERRLRDQLGRQVEVKIGFLQSQPFCRASRYASMRLPTPSLPIASER